MALDPLKRLRQRQEPSLAFHTIGVQGYFGSVQPPLSEIPGSAPAMGYTPLRAVVYRLAREQLHLNKAKF